MNYKVDFIITWVDSNDTNWQIEKNKYNKNDNNDSNSIIRYRDWNILKYLFRSIEKNASWVNNIYFITCGHIPKWLNKDNSKLKIIKHSDYIPNQFLPTFNSNVIELFFGKLPNLSEHFVYFNDDVIILKKIEKDYFFKNGLPKDALVFNAISVNNKNSIIEHTILNNLEILSKYFSKKEVLKNNRKKIYNIKYGKDVIKTILLRPWKYFTGVVNYHTAMPYLKSTWNYVYQKEKESILNLGNNKFRTKNDINHWLIRYWQMFSGKFVPTSNRKNVYYDLKNDNKIFFDKIKKGKFNIACINDSDENLEYEKVKKELESLLEDLYPEKSSFEK